MPDKRRFRPDDLYLIKTVFDPQVSPNGQTVAYCVSCPNREDDETQTSIWVAPLDGKTPARRFTHDKKDHSPRWSPDGRYLAFVSDRGEKSQLFVAPLAGGEARQVTKAKWGISQPAWSPDSARIAYAARTGAFTSPKDRKGAEKNAPRVVRDLRYKLDGIGYFDDRRMHIFVADVESGEERRLTRGDCFDDQPAWSPDGRTIAFVADRERDRHQRQWRTDVWTVPAAGGTPRKHTRSLGSVSHPAYSPDGRHIAYVGHEHGDEPKHANLMVIAARSTRPGQPRSLSASLDRPVAGWPAFAAGRAFSWARDSRSVYFLAGDRGTYGIYRSVLGGKPGRVLDGERQVESFVLTPDNKRIAFTAVWPNRPWELYLASVDNGRRELNLSRANEEFLAKVELGDVRRMTSRTKDGVVTESFVMYPPGYQRGRRYPLALNVHGGPHSYHPGSRAMTEFHALAAPGYVVVLPNPRGSTTYGQAFSDACIEDWGGGDYRDIMSAVDALVRRGVADPDRLFIGGYSYGGYMASWAVCHTDRFRAALVGAPVANLVSAFGAGDIPMTDIPELGGTPQQNMDWYVERSPVTHLANCNTPVLLIHHEGDLRCPIAQSEEIFQTLKALRKEVEFVRYPGGFHTYNTHAPSQTKDRIQRIIAFYDSHAPKRNTRRKPPTKPTAKRVRAAARH